RPLAGLPADVTRTTTAARLPTRRTPAATVKRSQRRTFVALRTGAGTRVVAVAWLLPVLDSGSLPTTVTVFVISPVTVGRTTSVIVTVEPVGTVPRVALR